MLQVKWNPVSQLADNVVEPPKPARLHPSEWYKKTPAFESGKPSITEGKADLTLKHCVPFADAMNAGYMLETWQEISFQPNLDGTVTYNFPTAPDIITHRDKVAMDMGPDYYPVEFIVNPPWSPELPKGWSMLYTHPMNRPELPFFVPSGIIDCDRFVTTGNPSSLPLYLKKSFSGILPIGTPIVQMVPIKRDNWESLIEPYDEVKQNRLVYEAKKRFWGGYKKFAWSKKSYK